MRVLGQAGLALLAGLVILVIGLESSGYDSATALSAMWRGAFGSWYAITSGTLVRAIPLILIGLGIAFAFRAGAFNIGAEGQFYAGAIAATWIGLQVGDWPLPLAVVAPLAGAIVAGALWIALPVWLKARFGVLEVISTLLLNFVAEGLVSLMVLGPLQEARGVYPQSDAVALEARLPFIPGTRLHWGFVAAILIAVGLWFLLSRTVWGFRLRAAGTNPRAAWIVGRVPVVTMTAVAMLGSAMLAGLAGGMEITGVTFALFQNLSPGFGFTAIAVALLARLHPLGVIVTGILFAALETGAAGMQRDAGIPAVAVYVVEAVVILTVLVFEVIARRSAPVAESEPA
jgi:general nucleoside transport system permease protein